MRRQALRPPTILGILSAVVGIISIVTALTPNVASRSDLVQGLLPPGVPTAARWLALAFGLALVWLAGSLVRGKQRAWQLAVVLVAGVAFAAEPVFAGLFGYLLAGDRLGALGWSGCAVILAGIVVSEPAAAATLRLRAAPSRSAQ